jgi:hypothetical protein
MSFGPLRRLLRYDADSRRSGRGVGMGTTYVHAVASLDGYIADGRDDVGPVVVQGDRGLHLRSRVGHGATK